MKHKGRLAYPGPADIEKYGLKLNGHEADKSNGNKSKVAEMAAAFGSGNGGMFGNRGREEEKE